MLQLFKKLKLYRKLSPDVVHKNPMSFQIKIYLWSLVDYQHLQKCFYNWNIILNYYFICRINTRGNFIYLEMHQIPIFRHHYCAHFQKLTQKAMCQQCQWSCHSKFWSIFLVATEVSFYLLACGNKISNKKNWCFSFQKSEHTQQ